MANYFFSSSSSLDSTINYSSNNNNNNNSSGLYSPRFYLNSSSSSNNSEKDETSSLDKLFKDGTSLNEAIPLLLDLIKESDDYYNRHTLSQAYLFNFNIDKALQSAFIMLEKIKNGEFEMISENLFFNNILPLSVSRLLFCFLFKKINLNYITDFFEMIDKKFNFYVPYAKNIVLMLGCHLDLTDPYLVLNEEHFLCSTLYSNRSIGVALGYFEHVIYLLTKEKEEQELNNGFLEFHLSRTLTGLTERQVERLLKKYDLLNVIDYLNIKPIKGKTKYIALGQIEQEKLMCFIMSCGIKHITTSENEPMDNETEHLVKQLNNYIKLNKNDLFALKFLATLYRYIANHLKSSSCFTYQVKAIKCYEKCLQSIKELQQFNNNNNNNNYNNFNNNEKNNEKNKYYNNLQCDNGPIYFLYEEIDNLDIRNDYGVCLWENGKALEAIEQFNYILNKNKNYSYAYNNRGLVYEDLKLFKEAKEDFTKAYQLQPLNRRLKWNMDRMDEKIKK